MAFVQLDPPALTFHPGFRGMQRLALRFVPRGLASLRVEVSAPAAGPFSWTTRLEHNGLLAYGAITLEVEFDLDPAAPPVDGFVAIRALDLDGRPMVGAPFRCELRGNVAGVGPGALSIQAFAHDRSQPGSVNELLFVANNSAIELDLTGCTFGEYAPADASQAGHDDDILSGLTLRPRATTGEVLRLWRGGLPPYADPRLDIALPPRGTRANSRDIAWIKNENGQLVNSCTYVPSAAHHFPAAGLAKANLPRRSLGGGGSVARVCAIGGVGKDEEKDGEDDASDAHQAGASDVASAAGLKAEDGRDRGDDERDDQPEQPVHIRLNQQRACPRT